ALLSAAVAWGGLSIHAQAAGLASGTDLRYAPFLLGRVLHSLIAALITFALWDPLRHWFGGAAPAFLQKGVPVAPAGAHAAHALFVALQACSAFLLAFFICSAAIRFMLW